MRFLLDMNLSPSWKSVLIRHGHDSIHWSEIGDNRAADTEIFEYAANNGYVIVTHDLDFGKILALTRANRPSVIQLRTDDVSPRHLSKLLIATITKYASDLEAGSLIVLDELKARVRVLPLRS